MYFTASTHHLDNTLSPSPQQLLLPQDPQKSFNSTEMKAKKKTTSSAVSQPMIEPSASVSIPFDADDPLPIGDDHCIELNVKIHNSDSDAQEEDVQSISNEEKPSTVVNDKKAMMTPKVTKTNRRKKAKKRKSIVKNKTIIAEIHESSIDFADEPLSLRLDDVEATPPPSSPIASKLQNEQQQESTIMVDNAVNCIDEQNYVVVKRQRGRPPKGQKCVETKRGRGRPPK
jgi:hypothetical protein